MKLKGKRSDKKRLKANWVKNMTNRVKRDIRRWGMAGYKNLVLWHP